MARSLMGAGVADFVYGVFEIAGRQLVDLEPATLTLWSAKTGGTQYTDLLLDGVAVTSIPVGEDGQVPQFQGPDGITSVWADAGGPRVLMTNMEGLAAQAVAAAASVNREAANGVAGLDASGKLYETRLPTRLSDATLGTNLTSSLTDAAFDSLLAELADGARVFIPEGVTVTLGAGHTLPKKVHIDGPGRIRDSRATPTTALLTIPVAASGTRISCPIDGSVVGTYLDLHNAIQITGTDGGAGVAPTYVTDVVIDCPRISGFGRFAVWGEFVSNADIAIGDAYNLGHGGVIVRSGIGVNTTVRRLRDVAPGPVGAETYGVQYDRRDNSDDLVRFPHSRECSARIDVARNAPAMNMLGTHGGQGLHFSFGAAYGVKRVIDIVAASGATAATQMAPHHISFQGGYANSGKTDGTMDSAVIIAGAYNTGTSAVIEYAKNVSGHINTIIGYGVQSDAIGGAVYCRTTQGLALSFGTFRDPSPRAVNMYHTNKDFMLSIGTVIDAWSTALTSSWVAATGLNNRGTIVSLRGTRGPKSATSVNARGVDVFSDATNKIVMGSSTNLTATAVAALVGPVTGWATYDDDQVAMYVAGVLRARFMAGALLMATGEKIEAGPSSAAVASIRIPHGAAPSVPVPGDMWTTTAGLFVRINGATVGPLT